MGKAPMKRVLLFAVTLALLATRTPACATDLKIIRCGLKSQEDAKIGSVLKHIDDKLVKLSVASGSLGDATHALIQTCRALNGDLTQTGAYMDAMITAANVRDLREQKLKAIYEQLQQSPEADTFSRTAVRMTSEFHRPECTREINRSLVELLNRSERSLAATDINCIHPPAE
jgi:hypothetical protein